MAFGKDKTVPRGPGRVLRVVAEHAEIKGRNDVGGGKGASRVAGSRTVEHFEDLDPHLTGSFPQFICTLGFHLVS